MEKKKIKEEERKVKRKGQKINPLRQRPNHGAVAERLRSKDQPFAINAPIMGLSLKDESQKMKIKVKR